MIDYNDITMEDKYRSVFSTYEGMDVLKDILRMCGCDQSSYKPFQSSNPNDVFYLEGRRSVALHILGIMKQPPNNIIQEII